MNKIKEDECYEYYEALFESYKVSFKVEKLSLIHISEPTRH